MGFSHRLLGYPKRPLPRLWLISFTLIFATVGAYFLISSRAATIVGDINGDGKVDITDLSLLLSAFGTNVSTCASPNAAFTCDLNGDGKVDISDLSILLSHYGTTTPLLNLSATPATITNGQSAVISWNSSNTTSCKATSPADWTSSTATSGTTSVSPTATTTYSMSCTGAGGTVTASMVVTVNPAGGALSTHVSGNKLIDQNGNPVRLIGVNRGDLSCATGNTVLLGNLSSDPATMKNWHINTVRIALLEDCWLGINGMGVSASTYRSTIQSYVSNLHKAGIYTILTLHDTAPDAYKSEAIQILADASHAGSFWQSVAGTFASDPAVIFDLINEPHPFSNNTSCSDPWAAWRDGCNFNSVTTNTGGSTASGSFPGLGEQGLLNAVRGTGAKNPVIAECRAWPDDCSKVLQYLPNDPQAQIIVSPHMYPVGGNPCATTSCWDTVLTPIIQQHPLVFGEYGTFDCSTAFSNSVMNWSDTNHAGYLAWRWAPYGCSDPSLLTNYDGTPNAYGQSIYNHFHAVNFGG